MALDLKDKNIHVFYHNQHLLHFRHCHCFFLHQDEMLRE
jgi:hypothetical protein